MDIRHELLMMQQSKSRLKRRSPNAFRTNTSPS